MAFNRLDRLLHQRIMRQKAEIAAAVPGKPIIVRPNPIDPESRIVGTDAKSVGPIQKIPINGSDGMIMDELALEHVRRVLRKLRGKPAAKPSRFEQELDKFPVIDKDTLPGLAGEVASTLRTHPNKSAARTTAENFERELFDGNPHSTHRVIEVAKKLVSAPG